MKQFSWCLLLVFAATFACGKNNGTPSPSKPNPSDDLTRGNDNPLDAKLAENSHWRAALTWNTEPRFSDEDLLEMSGVIDVANSDGSLPSRIENISLVADMPEMGHGTGNNLPRVIPIQGVTGRFGFDNLIFTMTGNWRLRIMATVDGKYDVWSQNVNVQ